MIDYEIKIRQIEEELRHEKAMRELQGGRLDIHDASFEFVKTTLNAVAARLNEITVIQEKNERMLRDLIQAITRERSNGQKKPEEKG